jgi:hypothetical protein
VATRKRGVDVRALERHRDELAESHAAAVVRLEHEGFDHAFENRRECNRLCDELAAVQRRIDDELARARRR